ncbi:MAG: class I SAM-dependent methyltransferase [Spirochaetaceae bacterium]|jgi:trans-aconitate methyltransferase|nr:class I SAM-dependent methyltransferase [Spirochaetaceae bacterium]
MLEYKSQYLKYLLPETPSAILEYGCGIGMNMPYLRKYFPDTQLFGCDISDKSISLAKENFKDCTFNAIKSVDDLNLYKNKIDVVFVSCVFHHIPFDQHEIWLDGLYDLLKDDGYIIIFEMNLKNPLTKRLVSKSPVDRDANFLNSEYCKRMVQKAFGKSSPVKLYYTYFFPWRNEVFTWIEHKLLWLPLGAQYCVMAPKTVE